MVTSVIMMLICYNESFPGHLIWAASSLQDTFNYQTVSFANDRFFYDNKYSFDGFSWVQLDTGFFKDKCFGKVIYDGKRYIAMNSRSIGNRISNTILTSTDGSTWNTQDFVGFDSTRSINDIIWNGKSYIGVGGVSDPVFDQWHLQIFNSNDCLSWTELINEPPVSQGLKRLAQGADGYLAIGEGQIYTSTDGALWQNQKPVPIAFIDFEYAFNKYFVLSFPDLLFYTPDGVSWKKSITIDSNYEYAGIAAGGTYLAIAAVQNGDSSFAIVSLDGMTWEKEFVPRKNNSGLNIVITDIAYGNNVFVATGGLWPMPTMVSVGKPTAATTSKAPIKPVANSIKYSDLFVSYNLPAVSFSVYLSLFDLRGRLIQALVNNETQSPGPHSVALPSRLMPGTYIVSLKAGTQIENKAFVIGGGK
jgi:hypothetical protein